MKNYYFILVFFISLYGYSQNYYYSKKVESLRYTNSKGVKSFKLINTVNGNFKLSHTLSTENFGSKPLFTVYEDNIDSGYYVLFSQISNNEYGNTIYEQGTYFSTNISANVVVLTSLDKTRVIIYENNKVIEYVK